MYFPQRERDRNFIAAPADPGTPRFIKTQAELALYHSPIWATYRLTEQMLERFTFGPMNNYGAKISPEEANAKYGLDGLLKFDREITPGEARLMMERKIAETKRLNTLSTGATTLGRKVVGFGTALAATIVDPVNAASMLIPVVGEAKFAHLLKAAGGNVTIARAMRGMIEGATGALMVEPFILLPAHQEQANYNMLDSAVNLGFGAILGGAFQAGLGKLGDRIKATRRNNIFVNNMDNIKRHIDQLPSEVQDDLMRVAMADVLDDKPVTNPADILPTDEGVIRKELRFNAKEARRQAMSELGFDVDQPDTFKLYDFMPDPKPNEPWFHGRGSGEFVFEKNRPAFFTRNPEAMDFYTTRTGEKGQVFVANLETKNPATYHDLEKIIKRIYGKEIIDRGMIEFDTSGGKALSDDIFKASGYSGENLNDAIYVSKIQRALEKEGFDSFFTSDALMQQEIDTLVVWNSDQIKTPGRRPVKTKTGIKWDPGIEEARTLDQRVKDLQKARIKNLIEKKRREFKRQLKMREIDPPEIDDAHAFDEPDIKKEIATIEDDVRRLDEGFETDEIRPEEQALIDDQMRDFANFDNDQRAIEAAINCVIRNIG